jgi:hypothetical protein
MLTIDWITTYGLALFFLFACISFAYKNNLAFRIAEHVYTGWGVGYVLWLGISRIYSMNLTPIIDGTRPILIISALLGILLFTQFSRRTMYIVRWPSAILVGTYLGAAVSAGTQSDIVSQLTSTFNLPISLANTTTAFNNVTMILIMIFSFQYFLFSKAGGLTVKPPLKQLIWFGRYVVLFGIGAYFGTAFAGDAFKVIGTFYIHLVGGIQQLLAII